MEKKINPNLLKLAGLTHNPNLKLPSLDEVFNETKIQQPTHIRANINPREYIQIPNARGLFGGIPVISIYELKGYTSLDWQKTHFKLFENGLYMPTPAIFMAHFENVVDAHKGKSKVLYVDSSEIPKKEIEELYKHLTINYKDIYGNNEPGTWTWLNAFFTKDKIKYAVEVKNKNLIFREESLEPCLMEDKFVDFRKLNKQGLARADSSKGTSYSQGENIKFWYPREGHVAGFDAGSGRAYLYCDGRPGVADASLGVFACAEKIKELK